MKRFIVILTSALLVSLGFAYTPTTQEQSLIESFNSKVEQVIKQNPAKLDIILNRVESIRPKFQSNERLSYVLEKINIFLAGLKREKEREDLQTLLGPDEATGTNADIAKAQSNCVNETVCGIDGVTYQNSCELSGKNISIAYTGECKINEVQSTYPGCGSKDLDINGIIWASCDANSSNYITWDQAKNICSEGYRLPTNEDVAWSQNEYTTEGNAEKTKIIEKLGLKKQGYVDETGESIGSGNAMMYWTSDEDTVGNSGMSITNQGVYKFTIDPYTRAYFFGTNMTPFGDQNMISKSAKLKARCIKK